MSDRRTKIVATVGPASDDPITLRRMIEAGVDVCRLGFAHDTPKHQLERGEMIREAADEVGRPVGLLADLPGPKVRAGDFPTDGVFLREGATIEMRAGDKESSYDVIWVDYDTLAHDVQIGDQIALGDGAVRLRITDRDLDALDGPVVTAEVLHGARVQGRPGVHLPAERVRGDVPTDTDLDILRQVSDAGFDFAAVSFVRDAADMRRARDITGDAGLQLVAKIETQRAVENLDEIIGASDAVMVARGDLGVECALEEIPHLQKHIIRRCVSFGRPVVTATQMLESMIHAPTPTRAEATDVANAVFDGTDALMLSAETAIGHDPVAVVRTMARIALRAEGGANYLEWGSRLGRMQLEADVSEEMHMTAAITHAAWRAAHEAGATAILCCTRTGRTARAIARFRPIVPLLGITPDARTARQLMLTWGAQPRIIESHEVGDRIVDEALAAARAYGDVSVGDVVAVLTGVPGGTGIDALRLLRVPPSP